MSNGTILLVEDKRDDEFLLKRALTRARILNPIQVVRDGEEAMAYFQGQADYANRLLFPIPIFMMLDLITPRISGFEVLEWLKDHPQFKSLPVVVLSGVAEVSSMKRAYCLGAQTYLVKPLRVEELIALFSSLTGFRVVSANAGCYIEVNPTLPVGQFDDQPRFALC